MNKELLESLKTVPIIAILRGVQANEVLEIAEAIIDAGIRILEVPLNSPDPLVSIRRMREELPADTIIGCGTLINIDDVEPLAQSGAQIAVTPNTNPQIIRETIERGITPIPGCASPTEALLAWQAGARLLKLFPASTYGVSHFTALRAVLPDDVEMLAVGGVGANNAAEWLQAGVAGIGIGSELYKTGRSAAEVGQRARAIVEKIRSGN